MQAAVKESGRLINDSTLVTGVLELPRAILNSLRIAYGPVAKNMPGTVEVALQVVILLKTEHCDLTIRASSTN